LVERGDEAAARLLSRRLLEGGSPRVKREAAEALARSEGDAGEVARTALAAACSSSDTVGLAAATALARLDDPRGRQQLQRIARSDAAARIRARALALLEQLGPP
jgi:HEAT repeat protein